jgi:dihydroflavonol-4-reductase
VTGITLVTGGGGFVGKHLVAKLRARGERVRSFDLAAPAHHGDMQGSITDADAVARAMENVTSVFHLAGNAQLWSRDASVFDTVNYQGTKIVAAAAKAAGARLVHCSSLTTLVSRKMPIGASSADEEVRWSPGDMLGAYPRSKLLAEMAVEAGVSTGLDAVIALPTEPLGSGDDSLTPPTQMILDFANGKTPAYIDCVLNFVPVDSLADGLIAARERGRRGQRYLLGGDNIPLARLLAMIENLSGRPAPKTKMPYWVALAAGAVDTGLVSALTGKPPKAPLTGVRLAGRQVSFSSEKAVRELGWRAAPVEPALKAMLNWARGKGLLKPV